MTKSLLVLNVGDVLISCHMVFESHMIVHTGEQPFACLQYNTGTKDLVQRLTPKRIKNMTMLEKKHCSCRECGKCFSYHQDVERHMTIHTRRKHFAKKFARLEHKVKYVTAS